MKAWTVRRLIASQRWDRDLVLKMRGTPKRTDPSMAGIDVPIRTNVRPSEPLAEIEPMRRNRAPEAYRSVYLKKEEFDKHGYTDGCE